MNSNWRNRPTLIDYVPKNIDYIIFIDESGNANLDHAIKANRKGFRVNESEKHFTITACTIAMNDFESVKDMVMDLKRKYWDDALFNYNGKIKRICFHSREIRGRNEAFSPNIIDYSCFISDLSDLMIKIPIVLYASHIDKELHVKQYIMPKTPYDLCMNFVLERIMLDIGADKKCIIILESRGHKEDEILLDDIKHLIDFGNNYHRATLFKKIKGVYFNPKWCKNANDQTSYWGLELSDLYAYPIYKHFAYGNDDQAYTTLLQKFSHYPDYIGKDLKSFP